MKRLAIVTTHPIQYNAPLFKLLTERGNLEVKVFYTWSQSANGALYDPGFGITKSWDIPLLEGYPYHFSENVSAQPGSHHFKGVINPKLISEILDYHPSAILVYGWSFNSHLKVLRYFKNKIPVFFRGDSTLLNEPPGFHFKKMMRRIALSWIYRHIDHAMYAGTLNKQYYRVHGVSESSLSFMPHTVDNNRFAKGDTVLMNELKQQLGIPEENIVFVYAGKFEAVKNPLLLLSAFKRFNNSSATLLLVGSGALQAQLVAEAAGFQNIVFLPFQNQKSIPSVYHLADVFVLPSISETWGLAINEAMAAGKPVLVSDKCGCHVDLVRQGENGYVFKSGDVQDLQQQMELLVGKGKNGLQQAGATSLDIIRNWGFEQAAAALEKAISIHA